MPTTSKAPEVPHATDDGLKRLTHTLDEIQSALGALRKDVGAGSRDLLKDLETLLKSARRDTSKLRTTVRTDLEQLAKAVIRTPAPTTPARKRRPTTPPRTPARTRSKKTAA